MTTLPPGHYVVTPDPGGELTVYGIRMRVLERTPTPARSVMTPGTKMVPKPGKPERFIELDEQTFCHEQPTATDFVTLDRPCPLMGARFNWWIAHLPRLMRFVRIRLEEWEVA